MCERARVNLILGVINQGAGEAMTSSNCYGGPVTNKKVSGAVQYQVILCNCRFHFRTKHYGS